MKGSDQCTLMAELAEAETTVSHGENQTGLEAKWVRNTDGGEKGETRRLKKGEDSLASCLVVFWFFSIY